MSIHTADAFMAIFGYKRVSSCYDCFHNQPQGCRLKRPEYETYTQCPEYDYEPSSDNEEKGESDDAV
jgi:hypothetical protein